MRVDLKTNGTEPTEQNKAERTRPAVASGEHRAEALDHARFSFDQTRVKVLERQVLAQPEVRQQRVDLLRQALGKGEYAISDGQVADAMFADLVSGSATQLTG